jgi:hypothetical protein
MCAVKGRGIKAALGDLFSFISDTLFEGAV